MIDSHSIDLLKTDGYLVTPYAALNNDELLASFRAFANTDRAYKQRFMQKEYGYAYDGYSYVGQADSSHQAEDDLVSTFVLSEFFALDRYPAEFQGFLNCGWKTVLGVVRSLELELLTQLDMPALLDFYQQNVGHMVSNNYYPAVQDFATNAADNTRLSAHPDASLFTVFPFGIDEELELELTDEKGSPVWQSVLASASILLYPGYLMEMWSQGAIKALNHRVRLGRDATSERFSFSIFSLPFPQRAFEMPGRGSMTSGAYFDAYAALF